jgi:hypothetical protein
MLEGTLPPETLLFNPQQNLIDPSLSSRAAANSFSRWIRPPGARAHGGLRPEA